MENATYNEYRSLVGKMMLLAIRGYIQGEAPELAEVAQRVQEIEKEHPEYRGAKCKK